MKKAQLIIFMMLLFAVCNAQVVTIPDANFKARLLSSSPTNAVAQDLSGNWFKIDANNDGQIQVSEALNVSYIQLIQGQIGNVTGIKSFANLVSFKSNGNYDIAQLDLSNMTKLKNITLEFHYLTGINTLGCPLLENFYMSYNSVDLPNLNFTQNPALKKITLERNSRLGGANFSNLPILEDLRIVDKTSINEPYFSTINLSNNLKLKKIYIEQPNLTSLTLNPLNDLLQFTLIASKLTSLNLNSSGLMTDLTLNANTLLTSVNFQNSNSLTNLSLSNNTALTTVDLQNRPSLYNFSAYGNSISSLNFSGTSQLGFLSLKNNFITSLDVSPITDLLNFSIAENITTLDVSQNLKLSYLFLESPTLKSVNAKNGNSNFDLGVMPGVNANLSYVCCDADRYQSIRNKLNTDGYSYVELNTYCSVNPGGMTYPVLGTVKYDSNNNGCDANDVNKGFQLFNVAETWSTQRFVSDHSGNYSMHLRPGNYTITPVLENASHFNMTPASRTASFPAQTGPVLQNFCLTANGTHNDLETVIIPVTVAQPGFASKYKIIYKNKGTAAQSGNVTFRFNDDLMNYLSSTVAPASQSTGFLSWNFSNLLPFETREIILTFNLSSSAQNPALNAGNVLTYTSEISGVSEETPKDNLFRLSQTVVNSFDPNNKTCLEGASISQTQVGDYVHYLIRFENNGIANARNIVVKDDIDTSKFDLSTLVPLSGGHSFVTKISGTNTAEFIFENIQLPFDDANNDGYVSFKIKTKSTLAAGNSFSNTARIYFDYNAPIVTNTYTTSVQTVLATSEVNSSKNGFNIYPNPVKDILHIQTKDEVIKAEIYDAAGRILNTTGVKNNAVNVSDLTKGNYIIKVSTKNKTLTLKFIKA
ncbi:T9SS type A sorting domain-containing protein [Chryseobacterium sp. JM1]|uniref:T9SS type A sorting domain-containing protein n=1 Tax=Chryseobacterium sp. JM1 TaxID=1233950 RepID=UPI0004E7B51B|nr:T9SS type A sorting domain-containing protein [Chryseobacterium sp. JM1]KFF18865.1 hypothetical protein IW22_16830 [Chryseobacterium sp. JM1]